MSSKSQTSKLARLRRKVNSQTKTIARLNDLLTHSSKRVLTLESVLNEWKKSQEVTENGSIEEKGSDGESISRANEESDTKEPAV